MTDETNYCKQCGANLGNVRSALLSREPGESFDWKKTWIADMLLTDEERRRRQAAVELAADPEYVMAAEIKRRKELKAGIVTCFSGIGGAIFLAILGSAIAEAAGDPAALPDPLFGVGGGRGTGALGGHRPGIVPARGAERCTGPGP